MKVLVTGHLGYIGVEAVTVLRAAGHEVVGLDIGFFNDCDFAAPPDPVPEIKVDLRDVKSSDLKGLDAVVHFAALSNDPLGDLNPNITYDINQHASVRLANAAKDAGVSRFIFSSSCSLYGAGGDGFLDETAAFNPVTPYGESKILVEQALASLADDSFTPMYLRNATAYGVSRRLRGDIVVNNLVGHAVTTGKVLLQSDGTPWRPLVHIRDIIAAAAAGLTAPKAAIHNQAFNIGRNGENYRIREVANLVAEIVPNCEVTFAPGASADKRDYRVDFTKAETKLPGFKPSWTLRAGIEELYKAYKRSLTAEDWAGPRYFRLKTVKGLQERGVLDYDLRRVAG
ncbi:MAG TPA: SDR family oxidoreductase [Polyangiales bacterium]|jgi:nucleoside-diphosphate-sugar epimerase|nr:SDR family oxidoreductase [Polyangiales bacterium]